MNRSRFVVFFLILLSFPLAASPYFANLGWLDSRSSVTPLLKYPEQLERIYHENNDQLIWSDLATQQHFEQQLDLIRRATSARCLNASILRLCSIVKQVSGSNMTYWPPTLCCFISAMLSGRRAKGWNGFLMAV